nr:MAG TPA: type IV like pilin [Caudoviricetes sp.]
MIKMKDFTVIDLMMNVSLIASVVASVACMLSL